MALTIEKLKEEQLLASLTPEQLTAIAALSAADENIVIGTRIGELHGSYEKDVFAVTGIPKLPGEKAYEYNKRVLSHFKNELETTTKTLDEIKAEKAAIEEQLKSGGADAALKSQLEQINKALKDAQDALKAKDELIKTKETEFTNQLTQTKVNFQFAQANKDIKLKPVYSDSIANTLLMQAKNEILSKYTPDFVVDETGKETLVFRDKQTNEIARNPDNGLSPYSIYDLYKTTVLKDAIDTGTKQPGGGTTGFMPKSPVDAHGIDLSGVKTQREADELIYNHLMAKGLARGTKEFSDEQAKIRQDNEVAKLPIR